MARFFEASLSGIPHALSLVGVLVAGHATAAQLTLTWTDNASNETGPRIERRLAPPAAGTYDEIATVGANVTSYLDTTVTAGQSYCYRVRAYNTAGDSGYSNAACAEVATSPPPSLTLTVVKTGTGTVTSTSPANAVNCGSDCTHSGPNGTSVTVAATPAAGFTFSG